MCFCRLKKAWKEEQSVWEQEKEQWRHSQQELDQVLVGLRESLAAAEAKSSMQATERDESNAWKEQVTTLTASLTEKKAEVVQWKAQGQSLTDELHALQEALAAKETELQSSQLKLQESLEQLRLQQEQQQVALQSVAADATNGWEAKFKVTFSYVFMY